MSQQSRTKKGPLPRGWVAYPSRSHPGKVYFYHSETRQSVWQEGITEIFDINQTDDNVGLFDDPDEGKKIKKILGDLTAATRTYIPTPIERKPSIVDQAIVRPSSPVNSPQDQSKELRDTLRNSESLEPLANHLSSLSKDAYFSDCDSQNSLALPQEAGSSTSCTASAQSAQVTNDFAQAQINNATFKNSLKFIAENVYSGYQSHVCSPQSSNNSSLDNGSDFSFYLLNQEKSSNALSRRLSPCLSPISDKPTSPQSLLKTNLESPEFPSNVLLRPSPRENSQSPSASPGTQRKSRDKFELDDNLSRPENQRERNRSPQSDQSSNWGSSKKISIWRHMDSNVLIVDQGVPPMADHRRPGIADRSRPPMAGGRNSLLTGWNREACSLNYGNNCDQPSNFRNEPYRPPNQFIQPRELEFRNQNHHSLPAFNEKDINRPRRILSNQVDNRRRPNYEQDNVYARNDRFPQSRFGPSDHRSKTGFRGSSNKGFHRNVDRFHSRLIHNRKPPYHPEEKGRQRYSHTSSVQNRISKVQNEVRSRDNQGLSSRTDRSIFSPEYPSRNDQQMRTPSPNSALIPTPSEMCLKFSQERPDVVQIPKLSPSAQQFENDRLARKRRFSSSPEIPISSGKDGSFDRKGGTSRKCRGNNSFDSKSSCLDKSPELPAVSNHKQVFKHPDSPSSRNQKDATKMFSAALNFPDEATIKGTPLHTTCVSQVIESPMTFITRRNSFEEVFPNLLPPTVPSVGSKTKAPTLPDKSLVEKRSDIPKPKEAKPEKLAPVKRVKFKEDLEELFDLDEGDYICAEDKQLMDFNLCDEPKQRSNLAKTSGFKEDKSDAGTGTRGLAQSRLKNFQKSLREERSRNKPSHSPMPVVFEPRAEKTDQNLGSMSCAPSETFLPPTPTSVSNCSTNEEEPMEWEDIPLPQIVKEVEHTRLFLSTLGRKESASWVSKQVTTPNPSKTQFCIVVDTNILLAGVSFVASLRDTQFKELGLPIIVIPWQVIQEIDTMKDGRSVIRRKAIDVKNFLYENFSNDHPRVRGQTMAEFEENWSNTMTPDDYILACARKLSQRSKVFFLTNDLNLATKAKIHGVETYTKEQMEAKIKAERESGVTVKNLSAPTSSSSQTVILIDNTICALKTTLLDYFTKVIQKGMIQYFGEKWWLRRCAIKPPWTTVSDCLMLLEKHQFSIFEHILPSSFCKRIVKDARTFFLEQEKGKRIDFSSVMTALKAIFEIVEFLKAERAYRDDSLNIIVFLEDVKRRLTSCSPSETDSKPDSTHSARLPSPSPIEADGEANLSGVAPIAIANPIATSQQMVVSPQSSLVVQQTRNVIPTRDALDKAYFHCRKWCASMCVLLKIANNFPADVEIVEKTPIEFKEQLPVLLQFVRELITCYQSLREATEDGEALSTETEDIKEIGRILCEFLNDHLEFSQPVEISDEDTLSFFTMTDQQSVELKKTGYTVLDELRKLFMKCSYEFKRLKIY